MLSPTISYSNTIIVIEIELSVLFLLIIASLILHRKNEIIERTLFFESINDSFSTFAAIAGILLVSYGHYIFDGIVSILIACMISYNAVKLICHNARLLLGMSPPNEFYNEVEGICRTFPEVKEIHGMVATYIGENKIHLDMHVTVEKKWGLMRQMRYLRRWRKR